LISGAVAGDDAAATLSPANATTASWRSGKFTEFATTQMSCAFPEAAGATSAPAVRRVEGPEHRVFASNLS
jgi:hypothetical protein